MGRMAKMIVQLEMLKCAGTVPDFDMYNLIYQDCSAYSFQTQENIQNISVLLIE